MSFIKVRCEAHDCDAALTVDEDQQSARCTTCGHEHAAPWIPADQTDTPTLPDANGLVTCERCGCEFDPNREPTAAGADTSRCSSCGHPHDIPAVARGGASRPAQTAQNGRQGNPSPTEVVEVGGQQTAADDGVHLHINVGNQ